METSSTASFHVLPSPSNPPFASERPALYGACVWTLYSFDSSLQFLFFISFFFSLTGLSGVDHAVFVVPYSCYFALISDYLDEMVALWRLSDLIVSLWSNFQAKSVGIYGFQCVAKDIDCSATFTLTHCGIQRYRRKNDWVSYTHEIIRFRHFHLFECDPL
ncbi:uncharacterized protein LOC111487964 isoform X2 [Cucurbita maxima]|uniref:Uncharacterized protein LOC111487964 isoform X2 n=1 Tax=Cucurbita maxima TaxID=3661 RepID=A0A6J1JVP6_CUCMA|nr:uncharacterized protein LOC111487964 isoform X2 [Cucurbita maxima]